LLLGSKEGCGIDGPIGSGAPEFVGVASGDMEGCLVVHDGDMVPLSGIDDGDCAGKEGPLVLVGVVGELGAIVGNMVVRKGVVVLGGEVSPLLV
jgi:hypothetical protein